MDERSEAFGYHSPTDVTIGAFTVIAKGKRGI